MSCRGLDKTASGIAHPLPCWPVCDSPSFLQLLPQREENKRGPLGGSDGHMLLKKSKSTSMHSFIYIAPYNYLLHLEASTGAKSETSGLCIQKCVWQRGPGDPRTNPSTSILSSFSTLGSAYVSFLPWHLHLYVPIQVGTWRGQCLSQEPHFVLFYKALFFWSFWEFKVDHPQTCRNPQVKWTTLRT